MTTLRSAILLLSFAITAPASGQDKGIYATEFYYINPKGEQVRGGSAIGAEFVINDFPLDCGGNKKGKFSFSRPAPNTLIFKCTCILDFIEHPRTKPETVTFVHTFKDRDGKAVLVSISSRNGLQMTPEGIEQAVNELGNLNR